MIRATNRQTSVAAASLRATDSIQRMIEAFFLENGWYYDRRKSYYQNNGKSPERIVGIPLLAQAVMAMGLGQPHNSRARPSSLLKDNDQYVRLFSDQIPLQVYLWAATRQKEVDAFLRSEDAQATSSERTNLRFHLSTLATTRLTGMRVRAPEQLRNVAQANQPFGSELLVESLDDLRRWSGMEPFNLAPSDRVAKGSDFVEFIYEQVQAPTPGL